MPYQVRPLGVLLAAVATFAVGMLWYSPLLFGKAWMRLNGYTPERMGEMKRKVGRAYLVSFVAYLVLAVGLDSVAGAGTPVDAIKISIRVWLFFVLPVSVTALMFSERPFGAWLIDAGYQVVYFAVMGVVLSFLG
jgi:hypothetical protein